MGEALPRQACRGLLSLTCYLTEPAADKSGWTSRMSGLSPAYRSERTSPAPCSTDSLGRWSLRVAVHGWSFASTRRVSRRRRTQSSSKTAQDIASTSEPRSNTRSRTWPAWSGWGQPNSGLPGPLSRAYDGSEYGCVMSESCVLRNRTLLCPGSRRISVCLPVNPKADGLRGPEVAALAASGRSGRGLGEETEALDIFA